MKKLTTTQWALIGALVIGGFYFLGRKKKSATDIKREIQAELDGDNTDLAKPLKKPSPSNECEKKLMQFNKEARNIKFQSEKERNAKLYDYLGAKCYKEVMSRPSGVMEQNERRATIELK